MAEPNGTNHVASPGPGTASQGQIQAPNNAPTPPSQPTTYYTSADAPPTSLSDIGESTRPRDARTIHMVLTSLGVTAYQERVPLQLLDFAYRYTASVLSDAQHLSVEGYVPASGPGSNSKKPDDGHISIGALRLATSSRQGYQFATSLPKETLLELATERNRIKLPMVDGSVYGVRLPHERYCLMGSGWDVPEEWDSEGTMEGDAEADEAKNNDNSRVNGEEPELEDTEMENDGFEQVFGTEEQDQDQNMDEAS